MKSFRSAAGVILVSAVFTILMGGCAHNPDVREGHDYTFGTTDKSPPDYLGCVKGELQRNATTYEVGSGDSVQLFVDSTDPTTANGLVEVHGTGTHHQFTAYQRDAWYDHGRLLDAALMCSKA
ncbi:hypothetical protein JET76_25115 [Pseudomonas putida]|uniref:hypothetical protein n=1 Tax=Pseudomonas putida TaxID=303 RepID=UPI000DB4CA80|nr:hypothetical protein [Pseudomonas putida]MBI6960892.1 hypothetical protein [Pseudomonas putida]PZQ37786.1 MAG: hypothetical protein DI560_20165 [Pseudomonas putida]